LHDGTNKVLKEVNFVPSLMCNLISLSELGKRDMYLKLRKECWMC